jgi:Xaa-Pro aminopeptidase
MFPAHVYTERRERLRQDVDGGLILFLGNELSAMNYTGNPYPFRQDSSFLYFFGLDEPDLTALIDVDEGTESVFGDDPTVEEIVWTGPQTPLREKCERCGVTRCESKSSLHGVVNQAAQQGRTIHFLPPYRPDHVLRIGELLGVEPREIEQRASVELIKAVVNQRSVKSAEEIAQIEAALDVSHAMQTTAMRMAKPGIIEQEVVGAMEGIAVSRGVRFAFEPIFSIHGETLHNPYYGNDMKAGDIAVNDSGAESPLRYASDITRTIPIGGRFSERQRDIYLVVLSAQEKAIAAIRPGVEFREIHRLASVTLLAGLQQIGLVKGDPAEAVEAGAHTLFFQCGLGHMMGLDVHDMQALGEDHVGYTDTIKRRPEFGWRSLRLAKPVEPGYVVTVEPGVYFIPELIDRWKAERKLEQYLDYEKVEAYRHFGGVRIEDDVIVTDDGYRALGKPIPKTIEEIEALAGA